MTNGLAKVEQKEHAQANEHAAVSKSASKQSALESRGEDQGKKHGFSKTVAEYRLPNGEKLGHSAAIVLRYLAFKVREHGVVIDGMKWSRITLNKITARCWYLGRSTVDDAITRLVSVGACQYRDLNRRMGRRGIDRGRCYHVAKQWMNLAEEEIRYFWPEHARLMGVPAAVIYANFEHWIEERRQNDEELIVQLSPADLLTRLPFSNSTIDRAIATLRDNKMIVAVNDESCDYTVGSAGSKPDMLGSKPDIAGSKPDEIGSNPDNNSIVDIVEVLKESSKTEAAPRSENSPCVEKQHAPPAHAVTDPSIAATRDGSDQTQQHQSPSLINWPTIQSLAQLHDINRKFAHFSDNALVPVAQTMADKLFRNLPPGQADDLYDHATDDEVFEAVIPAYQRLFDSFSCDNEMGQVLYYGTLEAIVGGFLWPRDRRDSYSHPMRHFIRISNQVYLWLWQRAEERRIEAVELEFVQRREEFRSIDADLEHRSDLSPAEKTRVFKQGLYSRNRVGGIHFDQVHRTEEIKAIRTKALVSVRRIFTLNKSLTAGDLLRVMDGCLALHRRQPAPVRFAKGVKWHARMGFNLLLFARNLPAIQKQLGMENGPVKAFLGDSVEEHDAEELAA